MPSALNQAVTDILRMLDAGAARKALARVEESLVRHPLVPGLYNIRGAVHAALDAPRLAVDDRRRAVTLYPGFHQGLFNLANTLHRAGQGSEALTLYDRVLMIAPTLATANNNAGVVLRDGGRWRDALTRFQRAVRADPSHVEGYLNLANIQRDLGDYDAAIASYRRSLLLDPGHPTAWSHFGIATQEVTEHAAAIRFQQRAVAVTPKDTESHRQLANLKTYTAGDPHLTVLGAMLGAPTLGLEDRARLHFALGKAHEDFGEIQTAFEHFRRGNSARKSALGYTLSQHADLFERIRRAFPERAPHAPFATETGIRPIFIVGMARSGTTLVEQVLANHPDAHGAGELQDLSRLAYRYLPTRRGEARLGYGTDDLAEIRRGYLEEISRLAKGKSVVIDKMPSNFQWVGVIRAALPEARIINTDRDPRAVAWSLYRHYFPTAAHGYAYDLDDIAGFFALYRDLMTFWSRQDPSDILTLNYETFTENPVIGTRDLLAWCGLSWSDKCLDFHRSTRPVKTASANQVRRAVYQGSSEAWRRFAPQITEMLGDRDILGFASPGRTPSSRFEGMDL
jgi:tetratricopeptide (TPR) repeat protein